MNQYRVPDLALIMQLKLSLIPEEINTQFMQLVNGRDVARLLEIPYSTLVYIVYKAPEGKYYKEFKISKRKGGNRVIRAPQGSLKIVQQKLNQIFSCVYVPKQTVHGFAKGKSICTNAKVHVNQRFVFNIDLDNFFQAINFGRVRGMFLAKPYSLPSEVATIFARLCCYQNSLPQGAPASPIVSNMICSKLDVELKRLAKNSFSMFTRYADDITFSTSKRMLSENIVKIHENGDVEVGKELEALIHSNGFEINLNKVRLARSC